MSRLQDRLNNLSPDTLKNLQRGLEKESLRTLPDGTLALDPHPAGLGASLTHPHITTDFSESQVELITAVHRDIGDCLRELTEVHQVVYREIGEQFLWCTSMPCQLPADDDIPIGQYGTSNTGRAKTVYRTGLKHRYGSRMQTISGLHYNFSLPPHAWETMKREQRHKGETTAFRNAGYFSLIRNFRRHSWLLLYLFGASPVVCSSFVQGREHRLQELNATTLYMPYATSLRMGPLGYQSDAQASLGVSYNCLKSYADSLKSALTLPYPPYGAIGLRHGDDYLQLSTSLLQMENEFYGTIRPKQPINPGERPLRALGERGVDYVEVRLMDLDPFSAIGITADTIRFLDIFLLHCLLSDSPADNPGLIAILSRNRHEVAERGRDPSLVLTRDNGEPVGLAQWGKELLEACEPIADALDAAHGSHPRDAARDSSPRAAPDVTGSDGRGPALKSYREALVLAGAKLADPSRTPSARMLAALGKTGDAASCVIFARSQSMQHRQALMALPLPAEVTERYERMAKESLVARATIEVGDTLPFETYRQHYLAQPLTGIWSERSA